MSDDTRLTRSRPHSRASKILGSVKSVSEFFHDTVDTLKDSRIAEAVGKVVPWAGNVTEAAGESFTLIQFALKLIEKFKSEATDGESLGFLALTIAYQHAVEKAIYEHSQPLADDYSQAAIAEARQTLLGFEPCEDVDIGTFSLKNAVEHEFVRRADVYLSAAIRPVGYSQEEVNKITEAVHDRFRENVRLLLSDGKTKEKFEPFTRYLELGADEQQADKALRAHAEYQQWLYRRSPILGKAPFALHDIYVEQQCGSVTWGEILRIRETNRGDRLEAANPFSESCGDRHSLLDTVLQLIGDPAFKDAIIVQGIAGAGKSSFTLKLCDELIAGGLRPLRIRLKDLRFDLPNITDSLPKAVSPPDEIYARHHPSPAKPADVFLGGRIFREATTFREAKICRYVLILDGWDEIILGSGEGFKLRVEKMLEQIRSEYLKNRELPVRVILTGRPTEDVTESAFLLERTRLLTIRPLNPATLAQLFANIGKAAEEKPVQDDEVEEWSAPPSDSVAVVVEHYRREYEKLIEEARQNKPAAQERRDEQTSSVGVLGLPLLTLLSARLIAEWQGDPEELVNNPTTLYRSLIDLTCAKAGKAGIDADDVEKQARVKGRELRELLQLTAAAMTVYGKDLIPLDELTSRLEEYGATLEQKVSTATKENKLSSLVISFYFKGGSGCEFSHKSFREYLFAEKIVETLKAYGRECQPKLPLREPYWKDFNADDQRYQFSRDVSKLLAPQWLRPEEVRHLESLIAWEFARLAGKEETNEALVKTASLDLDGWKRVRDGLADLWDWWAEGVHLRQQPRREPRKGVTFGKPFVLELIEDAAPLPKDDRLPEPVRTTTMDAHLGDGIFRLCVLIHHHVAVREGWRGATANANQLSPVVPEHKEKLEKVSLRRYQSLAQADKSQFVLFAPSGESSEYFKLYINRINSAGWRPKTEFPGFTNLSNINLQEVSLDSALLCGANLSGANLYRASLYLTNLYRANLYRANLYRANLYLANLNGANLDGANLDGAILYLANLDGAILGGANLDGANLDGAILNKKNYEYLKKLGIDVANALLPLYEDPEE